MLAPAVIADSRILIVDDEPANLRLLERILGKSGFHQVVSTGDSRQAVELALGFDPDLVLLDLHMPHVDGFAIMQALLSPQSGDGFLPILVLTADINQDTRYRALSSGARDFLTKPFDPFEAVLRIRNLLEMRFLHQQVQNHNATLADRVRDRTHELEDARNETLQRLALAAEFRDDATGRHTQRVGILSALIAGSLGLPTEEANLYRRAAPLHDIGKIGIPDRILLKPGALTPAEYAEMQQHTVIGARILAGSRSAPLRLAAEVAQHHHERWDGTGYPAGVRGEAIPLSGRIVAVADVFDALTHHRPYKRRWPMAQALAEVVAQSGRQFDPRVVEAFLTAIRRRQYSTLQSGILI